MNTKKMLALAFGVAVGGALGGGVAWRVLSPASARTAEAAVDAEVARWRPPARLAAPAARAAWTKWLSSAGEAPERRERLRGLLVVTPTEELSELLGALIGEKGAESGGLQRLVFDVWVERDAEGAARWAAAVATSGALSEFSRTRWVQQAGRAWAKTRFDDAYAWASGLADAKLRAALAAQLLGQLATSDPRRALALAEAGGEAFARDARLRVFTAWAGKDPVQALQGLGSAVLADGRDHGLREPVRAWLMSSPEDALAWLLAQPRLDERHWNELVGGAFADERAGAKLADLLVTRPGINGRMDLFARSLSEWRRRDPTGALAWLQALPDGSLRADILERVGEHGTVSDPELALAWARLIPDEATRRRALAGHLGAWAKTDSAAALAWIAAQGDADTAAAATGAQATLLGELARDAPADAAARWQALPEGEVKMNSLLEIARVWAKRDPASATRWMGGQTDARSFYFAGAWLTTAYPWSLRDPEAALAWAQTLPASLGDFAIQAMSGDWQSRPEPRRVADMLLKLEDPGRRAKHLARHVGEWAAMDRTAARAWMEANDGLPAEEAARILVQAEPTSH